MVPNLEAKARAKTVMKLIRAQMDVLDDLVYLLSTYQDYLPEDAQFEIADAVRHLRVSRDLFLSADRRVRTT